MIIQQTPIVSKSKTKWHKHQKNKNSQMQTYQILTMDDQMLISCPSCSITTVLAIKLALVQQEITQA